MNTNTNLRISIPKPCHEDWNKFTPDEKGAFCKVCSKSVHDFTKKSPEQISTILIEEMSAGNKVCGRFNEGQLDKAIPAPVAKAIKPQVQLDAYSLNFKKIKRFAAALFLVFGGFLFNSVKSSAQKMGKVAYVPRPEAIKGEIRMKEPESEKPLETDSTQVKSVPSNLIVPIKIDPKVFEDIFVEPVEKEITPEPEQATLVDTVSVVADPVNTPEILTYPWDFGDSVLFEDTPVVFFPPSECNLGIYGDIMITVEPDEMGMHPTPEVLELMNEIVAKDEDIKTQLGQVVVDEKGVGMGKVEIIEEPIEVPEPAEVITESIVMGGLSVETIEETVPLIPPIVLPAVPEPAEGDTVELAVVGELYVEPYEDPIIEEPVFDGPVYVTPVPDLLLVDGEEESPAITGEMLKTDAVSVPDVSTSLVCYPNPSTGPVNLKYSVSQNNMTSVTLYDLKGNMVKTLVSPQHMYAADYTTQFDISDLQDGVYICKLQSGDKVSTQRIVVAR